jgi:hypothetical protein
MGILDEAIREHLELKRQHGADDSELKQLEDDAFGPPQRPGAAQDAASEAATEFMSQPDLGSEGEQAEESQKQPAARREPVADVQEAPERVEEKHEAEPEGEVEVEAEYPAEEEQPAGEHEAVPPPPSHSTEERHAIADQPTEMFDVEKEFDAAPDAAEPSDDELVAEEITEPRLVPAEPLDVLAADEGEGEVEVHAGDDEDEDDFFDEQRLSDELDQALEAPLEPESEEVAGPASEEFESEEIEHEGHEGHDEDEDEHEGHDEGEYEEDEADSEEIERPAPRNSDEDVLEETPDFLEEAPEDDQLWFEQKPPKDFDFDD